MVRRASSASRDAQAESRGGKREGGRLGDDGGQEVGHLAGGLGGELAVAENLAQAVGANCAGQRVPAVGGEAAIDQRA